MRKLWWTLWCLVPIGASLYHYGPGQQRLVLDQAAAALSEAEAHAARAGAIARGEGGDARAIPEWACAVASYTEALARVPETLERERQALVLERAKCRMLASQLPEANAELSALVTELAKDPAPDAARLADARRTLASSEYYMTWLLRLEGAQRDEWEPRIEAARQLYKLLAADGTASAAQRGDLAQDLEAAVRLARMDLGELQGLPLPSQ